jgi:tripeptide aminopeptidase
MSIVDRFLHYTRFDTQSDENSLTVPSTCQQLVFADYLVQELKAEGLDEVERDDYGYVYATLKANTKEPIPTIGFIAHYDTSPDFSGHDVQARITVVDGEERIVTDGTTLLGADDKAGIAEIVEAMVFLRQHPEIKHGRVRIAFTPDEEIGRGADHFDVERFGCEWAYTMDGGAVGELEYENFNAAAAKVTIHGVSVHPGYAKDMMVNAAALATRFAAMLPADETPEHTENYQGFFHLTRISGTVEESQLTYIIRDHSASHFEERKRLLRRCAEQMNQQYGEGTVTCTITDQYRNMKEVIEQHMHVIDLVVKAMQQAGVSPRVQPIRGGTDGAQLSFKGLPCPNIFAGAVNMHGPQEYVVVQTMHQAVAVIVNICQLVVDYHG